MTKTSKKTKTSRRAKKTNPWMKQAIGVLMLVMLIPAQFALAQALPVEASADVVTAPAEVPANVVYSDAVAVPEDQSPVPTVQDALLNVCEANGYGQDCAKTLLGMLWTESSNQSTVIGDHGQARGYFQIHYKLHNISIDCAEDLVCSANWTINYLEAHSYPKYVNYAVQCHNSCGVNNGYAAKVSRNAKNLWDTPLEITQAAPIELAVK